MPRQTVRARQTVTHERPARMIVVTVATTSPLTVTLPGGSTLPGHAVKGVTYTVGDTAFLFLQQPMIGPVLPIL